MSNTFVRETNMFCLVTRGQIRVGILDLVCQHAVVTEAAHNDIEFNPRVILYISLYDFGLSQSILSRLLNIN